MNTNEHRAKQYKWLSEFFSEAARTGREMQKCNKDGTWKSWTDGPGLYSNREDWRLKPEPQKAWVVWGPGGPSAILGESDAKQYARECGGTIQEITRPD